MTEKQTYHLFFDIYIGGMYSVAYTDVIQLVSNFKMKGHGHEVSIYRVNIRKPFLVIARF
jgi:hypothetical protein